MTILSLKVLFTALLLSGITLRAAEMSKHPNGGFAVDYKGVVYHDNGVMASYGSISRQVFHPNRRLANDQYSKAVAYQNGQMAWDGKSGGMCYNPNGSVMEKGCSGIRINLSPGIDYEASTTAEYLIVIGQRILLSAKW